MAPSRNPNGSVFAALKLLLAELVPPLRVQKDTAVEFGLETVNPSPFPQHKGRPMWFGCVRASKAYVSFHLMPLYMNSKLTSAIPAELKARMQGKTCFNFKASPDASQLAELRKLARACLASWQAQKWI